MSRESFASKIQNTFGIDYEAILTKLRFEDNLQPWEICEWFSSTYGKDFTPSPITVSYHLKNIGKKMGRKSVSAKLLDAGVTNYRALLESLSSWSSEKISQHFKNEFNVPVSPLTLDAHFKNLNIKRTIVELLPEIHTLETLDKNLLANKSLPLERFFNGTSHLGFLQLQGLDNGIFQVESKLIVMARHQAKIEVFLKVFKGKEITETKTLHQQEVNNLLPFLTDANFSTKCKEQISNFVTLLEESKPEEIRNLLISNALNPSEMEMILERSKNT